MGTRDYTTRRLRIADAIRDKLQEIDGTGAWKVDLTEKVESRMLFVDDITSSPYVCVVPGTETREYKTGGFKWRFLEMTLMIYSINGEDSQREVEYTLEDVETQLEDNAVSQYVDDNITGNNQTVDITILSMTTDQGAFADDGFSIGEMIIEVRY